MRALLAHAVAAAGSGLSEVSDRDLLRRYCEDRDEPAFAELVRRYARLVWAVCRQQLPTDADAKDAFQATFLALARNPGAVRDGNRLGPFLHGVAVRVGSNARRSATRRTHREHVAGRVGPGPVVPDSAWDAAMAAVHAEAARLPEALRVPFVLCCLEGKGTTEAADLLGWKLGTLSGRLTRAKQTLLARLEARGLSAGAVVAATAAGGATAGVPVGVVARAIEITRPGVAVAQTVLTLSQGVVGMTAFRMKLVAAAVLVAGGLTTSVGSGWLATADAQSPKSGPSASAEARPAVPPGNKIPDTILGKDIARPHSSKWEYRYDTFTQAGGNARPLSGEFEVLLDKAEADGWQFVGEVNLRVGTEGNWWGGPALVFRRPKPAAQTVREAREHQMAKLLQQALQPTNDPAEILKILAKMRTVAGEDPEALAKLAEMFRVISERAKPVAAPTLPSAVQPATQTQTARQLETDIERAELSKRLTANAAKKQQLTAELDRLKAELYRLDGVTQVFDANGLPLSAYELAAVLKRLADTRDGGGNLKFETNNTNALVITGDAKSVAWAAGVVRALAAK